MPEIENRVLPSAMIFRGSCSRCGHHFAAIPRPGSRCPKCGAIIMKRIS